jgi:crotonobetainyl-CoA:carnitine CoA-transferase CaiB-like acyl-CoA transferase
LTENGARNVRRNQHLTLPLSGLKILDLTSFVSGPFCSQLLADLGAEVVKIERPPEGDPYRKAGPQFIDGQSTLFLSFNRNKKSIGLNLKTEEGKKIFLEKLVPNFDVLLENFSPGTMDSLGLGYERCRESNQRLIYCSITGFGEIGPYRDKKGFDLIIQAMSGIMDLTGEETSGPVKVGVPITDFAAGLFAAVGIVCACYERDTLTGVGKKISTSLYESSIALLSPLVSDYFVAGEIPKRMGSASPSFAPYQAFRAKDSYLCIAGAGTEEIWLRFVRALGLPELASEPEFKTNADRVKNQKKLEEIINKKLADKEASDWIEIFEKEGVPCGPVKTLEGMLSDPHTKAVGIIRETSLPGSSNKACFRSVSLPLSISGIEIRNGPPPLLGEQTDNILRSVGLRDEEIIRLRQRKIIL